jgi:superfamily II DNA or RNA helicase
MKLRPYQTALIDAIRKKFRSGKKRVILCAPTGAGKTVIFSSVVIQTLSKLFDNRALIVTDRIELLSQTWRALDKIGAEPVIYDAKTPPNADLSQPRVVVAMVETLKRRAKSGKLNMGAFDIVIIDEAHKGNFSAIFEIFPESFYIGATATPIATKKDKPLKTFWNDIVVEVDTPDLVESEYLVKCRPFAMTAVDTSNLKYDSKKGDYSDASLYAEYNKRTVYDGMLKAIRERIGTKKTIVFCVSIEHTENTYRELISAGYSAVMVTSNSTKEERAGAMNSFHSGESQFMVNCGILTTGYDHPAIEAVVLNRASKSLPLFLQCCGRGSRLYPGKTEYTLIDMGENIKEHGFWDDARDWVDWFHNPPKKGASKAPGVKECPKCQYLMPPRVMECPDCGHVFESKSTETVEGVLVELQRNTELLVGRQIGSLSPQELATLTKSGKYKIGLSWRVARAKGGAFLQEYARYMGYKPGWAYHQSMSADNRFHNITIK